MGKGVHIPSGYGKQQGFCPLNRDAEMGREGRDAGTFLKGQHTNCICSQLPWATAEGGQSRLEPCEESLGLLVALGRDMKGQLPGCLCSVMPPHCNSSLSWTEYLPSMRHQPYLLNSFLPHPVELLPS